MTSVSARDLATEDLAALIHEIPHHIDDFKSSEIEQWPVRSNRASLMGHPCARFLTYNRVAWKHAKLHGIDAQYVFDEGKRSELHAMEDLRKAGYTVIEGQRSFDWHDKQISGSIDGKILLPKGHPHPRAVPLEIKSTNPYDWERIESVEDLVRSHRLWLRQIPAQLTAYLLMNGTEEIGCLALRNRVNGRIKTMPVVLDYSLGEELVAKAERVNAAVAAIYAAGGIPASGIIPPDVETLFPERIPYDADICGRCAYVHLCLPDLLATAAAEIVDDPELEILLERRAALQSGAEEYRETDEQIKRKVGEREKVIVGNWLILSSLKTRKGYTVAETTYRQYKIDRVRE